MSTDPTTGLPYHLRLRRRQLRKTVERLHHDLGLARDEANDLAYDQPDGRSAGEVKAYMVVVGILEEVQPLLELALQRLRGGE